MKKNRAHIRRELIPDTKAPQSKDGFVFSSDINDWMYSSYGHAKERKNKKLAK